ncbi:MAG: Sir2 family NAD-dependent protein deacetylase, partial [Acidimicrobiia bacterium]|nr:Sir2 family NAD-dependent protein deacetylase [Acidimicrobiia bacterium]
MSVGAAVEVLSGSGSILVFTGAGISTESGIPDFRGPHGVWKTRDPNEFTIQRWIEDPEHRKRAWQSRRSSPLRDARPNDAHRAVAALWRSDRMVGCVTQNIDGLHQAAGLPDQSVVEIHGSTRSTRCLECHRRWPTEEIGARVDGGDDDPHCTECGGILKIAVISFGEVLPAVAVARAYAMAEEADAVLAIGSTLAVYPAADIPLSAAARGVPY